MTPKYRAEWEASGRSFAALAAAGWKSAMDAYGAARALTPPGPVAGRPVRGRAGRSRVRFKELLEFTGLEAVPALGRALARTRFRGEQADAFRRWLGPATVALLDASLSGHLRAWGY
jgi:hypothetical protein